MAQQEPRHQGTDQQVDGEIDVEIGGELTAGLGELQHRAHRTLLLLDEGQVQPLELRVLGRGVEQGDEHLAHLGHGADGDELGEAADQVGAQVARVRGGHGGLARLEGVDGEGQAAGPVAVDGGLGHAGADRHLVDREALEAALRYDSGRRLQGPAVGLYASRPRHRFESVANIVAIVTALSAGFHSTRPKSHVYAT